MTMRRYGSSPDQGVIRDPADEQAESTIRATGARGWTESDADELVAESRELHQEGQQ
jgi:hypothetical protein